MEILARRSDVKLLQNLVIAESEMDVDIEHINGVNVLKIPSNPCQGNLSITFLSIYLMSTSFDGHFIWPIKLQLNCHIFYIVFICRKSC